MPWLQPYTDVRIRVLGSAGTHSLMVVPISVCVCVRVCVFYLSCHSTHTTTAERRAEKQCRHRGANSDQKTKRGIELCNRRITGR